MTDTSKLPSGLSLRVEDSTGKKTYSDKDNAMPEELICPVCNCALVLNYGWLYSCNTEDCEMNGLILIVKNSSEHKEEFDRVSKWIRRGRAI